MSRSHRSCHWCFLGATAATETLSERPSGYRPYQGRFGFAAPCPYRRPVRDSHLLWNSQHDKMLATVPSFGILLPLIFRLSHAVIFAFQAHFDSAQDGRLLLARMPIQYLCQQPLLQHPYVVHAYPMRNPGIADLVSPQTNAASPSIARTSSSVPMVTTAALVRKA